MNPEQLASQIEERYRRYLQTTFYFKDPDLRGSFQEALESGHLMKGPYPETTTPFKTGQFPPSLFSRLLGSQPDEGFLSALQAGRALYRHQQEAIEKSFHGTNVVVATGTGSGKTEAFLYPILLRLYQEFREGRLGPGVRALVLYPMNALANDQRERLGEICKSLEADRSHFRFTFGQYIGETPENEKDSQRHAQDHVSHRLPGERVLRSEIRKTPPHILLTNYSMLEYLLLRPDDSPLFDNGAGRSWAFLVLDEAHQYRGSRGIEMAMLLRRLKQRLREGGRTEPFRCIATSATLVGGAEDKAAVAKFATDLFGEGFPEDGVILGQRKEPIGQEGPARYHVFVRSLEGAFVSYWPTKKVLLEHKTSDEKGALFEVALCRECGQHYFVGRIEAQKLLEAVRDPSQGDFGVTFLRPLEDSNDEDEEEDRQKFNLCLRCAEIGPGSLRCGHTHSISVVKEDPPKDEDRADQIAKCGACGYSAAGRDPVREVVHGADGPHAVIATTLYQELPPERKKVLAFADGRQEAAFFAWYLENTYKDVLSRHLLLKAAQRLRPQGREGLTLGELANELVALFREQNVLPPAAGDVESHRQAWLRVYREFLTDEQRICLEGVGLVRWSIKWPDWFRLPDILRAPPWSFNDNEALDLLTVLLDTMRADRAVEVRTEPGVSLQWNDLGLQASQLRTRVGSPGSQQGVRSWDGRTGKRVRYLAKLLLLSGHGEVEAVNCAVQALRQVWEHVARCDQKAPQSDDRLLLAVDDARRLNPDWWRLRTLKDGDTLFQCDTCGRLQGICIRNTCPRHRCPGQLQPIPLARLEPNHYRAVYQEDLPGRLRVEEHTAQLDKEKAREFQREFREGKIHVLSCSTTFELGVDLGDLDVIFLRNVPPEPFNYVQRVGRAGRRLGYAGFALTYCRRNPHDLYHFVEPERMVQGKIRPPVLSLCNDKIIVRHLVAVALSAFFRQIPERFKSVETLLQDLTNPSGVSDLRTYLNEHRANLEATLRAVIPPDMWKRVGLDDGSWISKVAGDEARFSAAEAEVSSDYRVVVDLENAARENAARDRRQYKVAEWAASRAWTIAQEDVLSFLSRKAVIPKYGFPVDVVELDTHKNQQSHEGSQVLLERDLSIAIAEFAPTSKLVANKKEWTSYGLKKVLGKEWERRFYKRCLRHNVFLQWRAGDPEPSTPCEDRLTPFQYVIPQFGFVTDRQKPREPKGRATRVFTTRPYFATAVGPEPGTLAVPADSPAVILKKACPGLMVVLCEGRRGAGFYVCRDCGAGFRRRERRHETAFERECNGTLEQVSLGHQFVTDIIQLQFRSRPEEGIDPVWFAYSLAFALVEGTAEVLEVPSTDLNATVAYTQQEAIAPIVLYDNVPGGAGLVARLEDEQELRKCLMTAHKRVSGACGCATNASCYGCLRSYRNQFAHQFLQRGPVEVYVRNLIDLWK